MWEDEYYESGTGTYEDPSWDWSDFEYSQDGQQYSEYGDLIFPEADYGNTDESFMYDEDSGMWFDTLTGEYFEAEAPNAPYQDFGFGATDESFIYDDETGTWFDTLTGEYIDADGNAQGWEFDNGTDPSFIYDPSTGLYFDTLTGAYLDSEGNETFGDLFADPDSTLQPRTDYWNETPQFIQPTNIGNPGGGFLSGLGSLLGNIFGAGPGGGGPGGMSLPGTGGGSSSSQQQGSSAQQQQQQAQQQAQQQQQAIRQLQEQLAAARRDASTPSAAVASLQNQIRNLQAAASGGGNIGSIFGGISSQSLLMAAAVGAVVYVATRPRSIPSAA